MLSPPNETRFGVRAGPRDEPRLAASDETSGRGERRGSMGGRALVGRDGVDGREDGIGDGARGGGWRGGIAGVGLLCFVGEVGIWLWGTKTGRPFFMGVRGIV